MIVVKVQRALFPRDRVDCLVYDEAHTHVVEQRVHSDVLATMKKRPGMLAFRAFFEAEWDEGFGAWKIGKWVKDRSW